MRVKALKPFVHANVEVNAGDVLEVADPRAKRLIEQGVVEAAKGKD